MQINQSKTREQFPLSRKKIIKKTLSGFVPMSSGGLIFLFVFLSVAIRDINALTIILFLVLWFLMIVLAYFYQSWYFAVYFYDLASDYIQIKKGPITPREITIPYERIQDVYVDQDLFDRMFGLYDVHLSSATISSGMEAHIDGLEKEAADGLRNVLLQTIQQRISKR